MHKSDYKEAYIKGLKIGIFALKTGWTVISLAKNASPTGLYQASTNYVIRPSVNWIAEKTNIPSLNTHADNMLMKVECGLMMIDPVGYAASKVLSALQPIAEIAASSLTKKIVEKLDIEDELAKGVIKVVSEEAINIGVGQVTNKVVNHLANNASNQHNNLPSDEKFRPVPVSRSVPNEVNRDPVARTTYRAPDVEFQPLRQSTAANSHTGNSVHGASAQNDILKVSNQHNNLPSDDKFRPVPVSRSVPDQVNRDPVARTTYKAPDTEFQSLRQSTAANSHTGNSVHGASAQNDILKVPDLKEYKIITRTNCVRTNHENLIKLQRERNEMNVSILQNKIIQRNRKIQFVPQKSLREMALLSTFSVVQKILIKEYKLQLEVCLEQEIMEINKIQNMVYDINWNFNNNLLIEKRKILKILIAILVSEIFLKKTLVEIDDKACTDEADIIENMKEEVKENELNKIQQYAEDILEQSIKLPLRGYEYTLHRLNISPDMAGEVGELLEKTFFEYDNINKEKQFMKNELSNISSALDVNNTITQSAQAFKSATDLGTSIAGAYVEFQKTKQELIKARTQIAEKIIATSQGFSEQVTKLQENQVRVITVAMEKFTKLCEGLKDIIENSEKDTKEELKAYQESKDRAFTLLAQNPNNTIFAQMYERAEKDYKEMDINLRNARQKRCGQQLTAVTNSQSEFTQLTVTLKVADNTLIIEAMKLQSKMVDLAIQMSEEFKINPKNSLMKQDNFSQEKSKDSAKQLLQVGEKVKNESTATIEEVKDDNLDPIPSTINTVAVISQDEPIWKKDYKKAGENFILGKKAFKNAINESNCSIQKAYYKQALSFFTIAQQKYLNVNGSINNTDTAEKLTTIKKLANFKDDGKYSLENIRMILS